MSGEAHDAAPAEAAKWRFVRRRGFAVCQSHGFREVSPSAIENAEAGERAHGGVPLRIVDGEALRADPMVSIARTYVEQAATIDRFARWMTAGDVFDSEPLGALRWRTWQALSGVTFGAAEPAADAEVAALFLNLAADLGLNAPEVVVSTVGDPGDVQKFIDATAEIRMLRCAACRGSSAPLRFLTCDDEGCAALIQSTPPLRDFIGIAALKHHESLLATLDASGFQVRDDPRLGFGSGRYNRTVLELRATPDGGGAPMTIARGGRRDNLQAAVGGAHAPSVGFTIGVARAAACVPGDGESYEHACELFIAARGAAARAWALRAAAAERSRGFRVDVDLREVGWADQLQRAERVRARVVVVVGEVERKKGEVAIRDMITRETRNIPEERLPVELKRLLR